jgi:hypothetical protein
VRNKLAGDSMTPETDKRLSWITIVWLGLLVTGAWLFLLPTGRPWIDHDRMETIRGRNAAGISMALCLYHEDHAALPESLADLIPKYIPATNVGWLLPPGQNLDLTLTASIDALRERVKSEGVYEYLGTNGNRIGILAYERDRLHCAANLSLTLTTPVGVYTIPSDFGAVRLPQTVLRQKLIAGGGPCAGQDDKGEETRIELEGCRKRLD